MIRPDFLREGDTISIVAPGRKINELDVTVAIKIFESWGLRVSVAKNIFNNSHSYLAGTDAERLEDFQTALDDVNVKAIVCARGGYGSVRIIEQLTFAPLKRNPKWIVGFSDITAFHLKLNVLGYESIHSTMPVLFSKKESTHSVESLRKILFGTDEVLSAPYRNVNRAGVGSGEVVGGNLSLLASSLATPSEPVTKGKIIVIEEISEYLYKIDRMMNQLKQAKKFDQVAGLIVGHFTDILDTEISFGETVEQIILRAVSEYNFPVAFDFPIGHDEPNLAWRSGGQATLRVNEIQSTLNFK